MLEAQLLEAAATFGGVSSTRLVDGTAVATFYAELGPGWNRPRTTIRFIVPLAFPAAQPDCFFAEADLRLVSGAMPSNTGIQALDGVDHLWFSWHVASWNPSRDTVCSYIRFIERRLHDPR